jgi:hypothetical protein
LAWSPALGSQLAFKQRAIYKVADIDLHLKYMSQSALVVSFSNIEQDPRVLRQIQWLTSASYDVVTIGLGQSPAASINTHFQLKTRSLLFRVVTYVLVRKRFRYWLLIEQPNRLLIHELYKLGNFDLIVFNDIDLLPLAMRFKQDGQVSKIDTRFHLDLHEYFPDHGIGLVWKLLFKHYGKWLQSQLSAEQWDSVSTVAPSIAKLYEQSQIFRQVSYVLSAPRYEDIRPTECVNERINLVYHGLADLDRGLVQLIKLVSSLEERFHLHLMLVGPKRNISTLMKSAKDNINRIHFCEPVKTTEIARAINQFDIEVIFFVPHTLNLRYSLPNKYFEAVQAKIAIVHGTSPSMQVLSDKYKNGFHVDDWDFTSLGERLNSLTVNEINTYKTNSVKASFEFSSENEGSRFISIVEGRDQFPHN